jgi:membrane protein implicated in regulation of membrane protease activity
LNAEKRRDTAKDVAIGLIALIVLLAVALLFVLGFVYTVVWLLGRLESQVAAAVAAASATAIASVLAIILSKRFERRAQIAQEIRERKSPAYETLIGTLFKHMFAEKSGRKRPSNSQLTRILSELTPQLIVWGSQDVINAWIKIREHDWATSEDGASFKLWNDLMIAIRKDLGNDTDQLANLELIRLFINFNEDDSDSEPPQAG